jgi:SAM-dependent methyltransferase
MEDDFKIIPSSNPADYVVHPEHLTEFLEAAKTLKWRFARTMASVPHSYVVRGKSMETDAYRRAFGVVQTFGVPGNFHERTNIYLHDPETNWRWWNMTNHEWESIIMNVAKDGKMYGEQRAPDTSNDWWADYDAVAPFYDDVHNRVTPAEKTALWRTVDAALQSRKPVTLDLGAGTGGTLDSKVCGSVDTTVVDVSQGMLNALVYKHPRVKRVISASAEEYLAWNTGELFDLVTASFGSASYLSAEAIDVLPEVSRWSVVLSFYKPGYVPPYHQFTQQEELDRTGFDVALDLAQGRFEEQGNFITMTINGKA